MENKPKRVSSRTPEFMANMALGTRLNKVGDGIPVLSEHFDKSMNQLAQPQIMNMSHIPVNVEVDSVSYPLPLLILEEVIRRSAHRVICNTCSCREATRCKNFAYDEFGCIHIGLATEEHNPSVVQHTTVEDTIAHLRKSVAAGLVPWVGHAGFDNWVWDISPDRPFLTVCLCCPCCCSSIHIYKRLPKEKKAVYHRLKGLQVFLDENRCKGCGKCAEVCFARCISMEKEKSRTDDSTCTGCGFCAQACPENARSMRVENLKEAVDEFLHRLAPEVGGLPVTEYDYDSILKK